MSSKTNASEIKKERRKKLFLQEFAALIQELSIQEPLVAQVYVSSVDLSADTGICHFYFSTFKEPGEEIFAAALEVLKLYRPSLRKAFVERINMRYGPDLMFAYDKSKEKERRINSLLDKVSEQLSQSDDGDTKA